MPGTLPAKEIPPTGFLELLLLLLRRRRRMLVEGNSMLPFVRDGDVVVVHEHKPITLGDVIVVQHPFKSAYMVKRVFAIDAEGRYELRGDNPAESTDSRNFGPVQRALIIGVVTSIITN